MPAPMTATPSDLDIGSPVVLRELWWVSAGDRRRCWSATLEGRS
ncbi:hypothetical protein ACFPRL_08440 [Pseudoclavibacter helvolus]